MPELRLANESQMLAHTARYESSSQRWELTPDERANVGRLGRRGFGAREALRAAIRSPGLLVRALRAAARGAVAGVRADPDLAWALHVERVRRVAPGTGAGADWHGEASFVEALEPHLGADVRALEMGCGGGRVSRLVAPRVGQLVCSDVSRVMLDEAQRALEGQPNVALAHTDGRVLHGLANASFDLVLAHDVFVTLDLGPALAMACAARRVLREGGTFTASFYTIDRSEWAHAEAQRIAAMAARGFGAGYARPYVAPQVEALLKAAGFQITDRRYGEPEANGRAHYIITGQAVGEVAHA